MDRYGRISKFGLLKYWQSVDAIQFNARKRELYLAKTIQISLKKELQGESKAKSDKEEVKEESNDKDEIKDFFIKTVVKARN